MSLQEPGSGVDAKQEHPVYLQHEQLSKALALLDDRTTKLVGRLERVLTPDRAVTEASTSEGVTFDVVGKPLSPLGQRIREDERIVNDISDRVADLLDRLEV